MKFKLLLLLAVLLTRSAFGQETSATQFRMLAWSEPIEDIYYKDGEKKIPVTVYSHMRSPLYKFHGEPPLVFFRDVPTVDGSLKATPIGSIDLASAGTLPLLLFLKNPALPGTFTVDALPDDLQQFSAGSYQFLNYTPSILTVAVGNERFSIRPAERKIIKPFAVAGENAPLAVKIFGEGSEKERPVFSNVWSVQPNIRTMVLMAAATGNEVAVQVKSIAEVATAEGNQKPPQKKAQTLVPSEPDPNAPKDE